MCGIRDGRRLNVASSYLYPVMDQANLTVLTGAYVSRLTIEDQAATGVVFEWQGQAHSIKASATATLPPAPGRFSTTNGCPHSLPSRSASTRATMSTPPPGGAETTILTVRLG